MCPGMHSYLALLPHPWGDQLTPWEYAAEEQREKNVISEQEDSFLLKESHWSLEK